MKKLLFILVLFCTSCMAYSQTNFDKKAFEQDAKKMVGFLCKMNELNKNTVENQEKMKTLLKEMQSFSQTMKKKYGDIKDNEEMRKIVRQIKKEELTKCGDSDIVELLLEDD